MCPLLLSGVPGAREKHSFHSRWGISMALLGKDDTPRGCFVQVLAVVGCLSLVTGAIIKTRGYGWSEENSILAGLGVALVLLGFWIATD